MNYVGLIIFVIGAILGGIIENFVLQIEDMILEQFNCENINNENFKNTCNNNKLTYSIATKIVFPIVGGLSLYAGIKKRLNK